MFAVGSSETLVSMLLHEDQNMNFHCCVKLEILTTVSEEPTASIFRVEMYGFSRFFLNVG
jgi:hypothetical protein